MEDGKKERGAICKVCDRKFLIRESTLNNSKNTQKQKKQLAVMQTKLEELKSDNIQSVHERDQERFRYKKVLQKIETEIEENTD